MAQYSDISILTDSYYFDHDTGGFDHPETPVRLEVIVDALVKSPLLPHLHFIKPCTAPREWLMESHDENWLFRFEEQVLSGKSHIDHVDNQVCFESYKVACLAAGAGLCGIDLIENKKAEQAFCLVRPPGHHAEKNMPFGFCFFNNSVIAANYWKKKYGRKKTLVFDFDAHHGNGIQSAFEKQKDVYYLSFHEHPSFSFPGTGYGDEQGFGDGKDTILNIPLHPGSGDEAVLALIHDVIEPKLEQWHPEAIIVSAGFDAHSMDDMSGLDFSTEIYAALGKYIRQWSLKYCQGRLLSILEGGYELRVLGECVEAYLRGLISHPLVSKD
jgi:acetoin utilization deacetylase AcuC-like enzyme